MVDVYNLYNLEPRFKNYLLAENISAVTLKNYLSDLRHFLGWLTIYQQTAPAIEPFAFEEKAVDEYVDYLRNNDIPTATVNRRLSTLRKFCAFCFESKLIRNTFSVKSLLPTVVPSEAESTQINSIKQWATVLPKSVTAGKSLLHNTSLVKYTVFALVILAVSGYLSITTLSKKQVKASSSTLPPAARVLSFQGSLTDNVGNPVDVKTDVTFRLYPRQTGGTPIYTGQCVGETALTPDVHGIFSAIIGSSCGMKKIPATLFTDNPNLYLGITVGSDPEMKPRQKIANVGTAASAQNLEGVPLGTGANAVPYIDSSGVLAIGAASPTIQSSSGTFTIKGSTLTLATTSLTDGNINFSPSIGGNVFITRGNLSLGDSSLPPSFKLQVTGDIGPSLGYAYSVGSPSKQWANIYGEKLYQNNYQVCDVSGNCDSASGWTVNGTRVYLTGSGDNVGIGTSTPIHRLQVEGTDTGKALMALWEKGDQDLIVASNSASFPTTIFRLTNSGNIKTSNGSRWMPLSDGVNSLSIGTASDVSFVSFDTSSMRVGIGTTVPIGKLHVSGAITGKALTILDETGDQNILVASASGITKFVFNRDGNLAIGQEAIATNRQIDTSSGGYLTTSGVWTDASSRAWKTNFTDLDYALILNKVKNLSVTQWNYKSDSSGIKHIGPVAEDFYAAFGLGNDNQHIASLDSAGIALAAVKGVSQQVDLNQLHNDHAISLLSERIDNLETRTNSIENSNGAFIYNGLLQQIEVGLNQRITDRLGGLLDSLHSTYIEVQNVLVKNSLIAKSITSESLLALNSHVENLTSGLITVREKISSPVVETKDIVASGEAKIAKIKTNQITASSDNLTIDLNNNRNENSPNGQNDNGNSFSEASNSTNQGPLAQLIIKGLEGRTVASVDAAGNATFSGTLKADSLQTQSLSSVDITARSASISGDLIARNIHADNIDALTNQINNAQTTLTNHSTDLQQLSNNINEVQQLLAQLRNQPINSENYQNLMQALTLSLNNVIQPENTINNQLGTNVTQNSDNLDKLTVLGSANIYKAGISDSLTVGNVFVRDNSILSLAWDLDISSLSAVNFFGGIVSLHKNGDLIANGQVIAQGGVRTNTLSQLAEGDNIAIQLKRSLSADSNPKLTIQDENNKAVASISNQGEGYFKSLALDKYTPGANSIIAASDNFSRNGQFSPALETKGYTAGEGLLPNNNPQVIIYNDRVKDGSLIYLTSTSTDSSIHLSITEKKVCGLTESSCRPYFKVGSDKVSPTPITFNWLLVN